MESCGKKFMGIADFGQTQQTLDAQTCGESNHA